MPPKKATRRPRRVYKRRRYNRRKLMNLTQQVVPIVAYKKVRYCEPLSLLITNGFTAQAVFSLNGLYDPNVAFGGHQPLYFDQMMALYNKACVLGSKVKVLARPGSTSNTFPMDLIAEISQLSSLQYLSGSHAREKRGTKILTFNSSASNVYNPSRRLTMTHSCKKEFRAKDRTELISNDDYNTTSSSNPNTQSFLYLTYQGQNQQQTTAQLFVDVVIEYIVAFHDKKQVVQS